VQDLHGDDAVELRVVHAPDLATDELRLNVDVFRARKQFAALGIQGAANIVDRRTGTGRIRLGVERVEVRRA
jgi:hypothetical protein